MKTGLFCFVFYFVSAVKVIVLGLLFKDVKKPGRLHMSMHWNQSEC